MRSKGNFCTETAEVRRIIKLYQDPDKRTANENEVIETVRIGIEMANEKLQKDVDRLTKQLQSLPASDPARTKIQKRIENKQKNHPIMPTSDHWMLTYETCEAQEKTRQTTKKTWYEPMAASSQAGTETCIFRTVQSKQCERQDQIYRRIKTNSRKKDGLKVSS